MLPVSPSCAPCCPQPQPHASSTACSVSSCASPHGCTRVLLRKTSFSLSLLWSLFASSFVIKLRRSSWSYWKKGTVYSTHCSQTSSQEWGVRTSIHVHTMGVNMLCKGTCVHKCTWMPEVIVSCLPQPFPTLLFEAESLIETGLTDGSRLDCKQAPGIFLSVSSQLWGSRHP